MTLLAIILLNSFKKTRNEVRQMPQDYEDKFRLVKARAVNNNSAAQMPKE
jgi:hypothetical protein